MTTATILSACTSSDDEPSGSQSENASGTCEKQGGSLIAALPGDIATTDPVFVNDSNSAYVLGNVLQGLMGFAPYYGISVPVLAAEPPSVSSDGLSYTFKLRQGVKFQDDTDLNADAVKYNFDRWLSMPEDLQPVAVYVGSIFGFEQSPDSLIKSVTAVDDSTVEIALNHPNSSFLTYLTLPYFVISSPAALKAGKAEH